MRLLCFADVQATDGDEMCRSDPTISLQHYRVSKFFKDLKVIYDRYECEGLVDLGDTTDDRSQLPVPTLDVLCEGLERFPLATHHYKLIGNHEQYTRDTRISTHRLFSGRFQVITGCEVYDLGECDGYFCSYPADYDALQKWIKDSVPRNSRKPRVLFGHFQVMGCAYTGAVATSGVPQELLKEFDTVLLGHVHLPQTLGKHIHYVGSPFQQDWGEAGQSKRVAVLDTDDQSVTWVPLTGYPEYRSITWAEFLKLPSTPTEHRYRVSLANHAEAEAFYAHPNFGIAEPVYAYSEVAPEEQVEAKDWSFDSTVQRWLKLAPPQKLGVELPNSDMLEIGQSLAKG